MKYYQAFYNASESGINGSPGFGIRTATEGIPEKYLSAIEQDSSFSEYLSGDFSIPSTEIFEHPERIYEYPRTYFHKILPAEGKPFHVLARQVYACFDYPFYQSGALTRPGNFVAHFIVFEGPVEKEYFDLLFECPAPDSLRFLPADYRPVAGNPEMRTLMLGSPVFLAPEEKPVTVEEVTIPPTAFSLYFQLVDKLDSPKPIVVRAKADEAAGLLAGALRLLPPERTAGLPFMTNYQGNGIEKDIRLTFINEYYAYQVYPSTCEYIDLMDGALPPTRLESAYRADLEKAVAAKDTETVGKYLRWIPSDYARRICSRPEALVRSVFHYIEQDQEFTLEDVDRVEGLLPELKQWIGADAGKAARINALLAEEFRVAECLDDFSQTIALSEKVRKAGIPVGDALSVSRDCFTAFLLSDVSTFAQALVALGKETVIRYADSSRFPGLTSVLQDILESDRPLPERLSLVKVLEEDPGKRVSTLVELLGRDPVALYPQVEPFLNEDKTISDKENWMAILKDFQDEPAFAELFYTQLVTFGHTIKARDRIIKWAEMAGKNPAFAELLFTRADKAGTYASVYRDIASLASSGENACEKTAAFVDQYILSVIPETLADRSRWELLVKVLRRDTDVRDVGKYFETARNLGLKAPLKAIAPKCLKTFSAQQDIGSLVNILVSKEIMKADDIVAAVKSSPYQTRLNYWSALVDETQAEKYEDIARIGYGLHLSREDVHNWIKAEFPKEYTRHQYQKLLGKVTSFFTPKEKQEKGKESSRPAAKKPPIKKI